MELRQKPPGSWYVVVLKTSAFSHAHNFAAGAFGAKGTFPVPELGTQCVCCDRQTPNRRAFDASTDRITVPPIDVPMCVECEPHVPKSTTAAQLAGAGICVGGGLAVLGVAKANGLLALPGLVILGLIAWWGLALRAKRRRLAADGHHCGLEIGALNGLCSIRTTNRRVAIEVARRNQPIVHKAR